MPGKAMWPMPRAFRPRYWGAGNARPWKPPCPAARSAPKLSSYGPRSSAWKWSALFKKSRDHLFPIAPVMSYYACTELWPVQFLCRVLAMSPAGYY